MAVTHPRRGRSSHRFGLCNLGHDAAASRSFNATRRGSASAVGWALGMWRWVGALGGAPDIHSSATAGSLPPNPGAFRRVRCTRPRPKAATLEERIENMPLGRRVPRPNPSPPRRAAGNFPVLGARKSALGHVAVPLGVLGGGRWVGVGQVEPGGERTTCLGGGGGEVSDTGVVRTAGHVPRGGVTGGSCGAARWKAGAKTGPTLPCTCRFHLTAVPKTYRMGSGRR